MSADSTMDEGPSSQLLGELHRTASTAEDNRFDLATPRREDVDPTQQALFFPPTQGDWLSSPAHSNNPASPVDTMKATAAASRAASPAGDSDGYSSGPGASTPGTSENGEPAADGQSGHGNAGGAAEDEEMDDGMGDVEDTDGAEDDEEMEEGTGTISLYKFTPLGLSEKGTGELLDEDGDVNTEDVKRVVHGRAEVDKNEDFTSEDAEEVVHGRAESDEAGDVTTEDGGEVVQGRDEDTTPDDGDGNVTAEDGRDIARGHAEEEVAVDEQMADAYENAAFIIDDDEVPEMIQSPELSKEQRGYQALHKKALSLVPHKQAPARYWVAVLHHTIEPKDVKKEKDFLWIKANHKNTVETIWHTYQNATTEDVFSLHVSGENPEFEDQLMELDFYSDKIVVFNVKIPNAEEKKGKGKEKKKREKRKGGEDAPVVIDDD